jgi:Protein of unknown function (DUF4079)
MTAQDWILLLHPAIAIVVVFPLLGIVVNRAAQTRNRRLQLAKDGKSKIPPAVGQEHVQIGQWLTGAVVGIALIALGNDIVGHAIEVQLLQSNPVQFGLIIVLFLVVITSLVALYWARQRLGRGVFATLTGTSLVILGCQEGVYRNTENWFKSHYYYGITATLLVIFSLAILPEIYKDRTNLWRKVHISLNSIALLLFLGQSVTGTLSLLEVPLHWQKPYIQKLYEQQCDRQPCSIQPTPK